MATIADGGVVVEEIGQGADAGRCEVRWKDYHRG